MRRSAPFLSVGSVLLAACAGGGSGSAVLGYAVPSSGDVTYVVGDTLTISLQGLGDGMEIGARSAATYSMRFGPSSTGVRVTARVVDLAADVVMPGASPLSMDESGLEGDFVFELDRRGRARSMSSPQASQLGAQVFSAPVVAHALFPRLPGGTAAPGDQWMDTVTYREEAEAGVTQVRSDLTYSVVGESRADARALLDVTFQGTAAVTQDLTLEGARINQSFEVQIDGRFRWDAQAGLLYDSEMSMEGPGSVRIALLPGALPTRVRWLTRVRLQPR